MKVLKLLLPALFPSWRFFDVIAPSPRIEFCLLEGPGDTGDTWRESRGRPRHLQGFDYLKAFFWNPRWNETLYLATCAERLIENPTEHVGRELRRRISADLVEETAPGPNPAYFRFRLVFISRHEGRLRRDVTFVSPIYPVRDPRDR